VNKVLLFFLLWILFNLIVNNSSYITLYFLPLPTGKHINNKIRYSQTMILCHFLFTAVCGGISKMAVNLKFVSQGISVHRFFFLGGGGC
jgi:hypothetical protein